MIPAVLYFDRLSVLQAATMTYALAITGIDVGLLAMTKASHRVPG